MATDTNIEKRESEDVQAEKTRDGRVYRPNVDIIERGEELLVLADLPGTKAEDIDISFEKGVLSLNARVVPRQRADQTVYVDCEYGVRDYARSFQVGEGIDTDKMKAEFTNGVLTLHLPKTEEVMPKKISVKTA